MKHSCNDGANFENMGVERVGVYVMMGVSRRESESEW